MAGLPGKTLEKMFNDSKFSDVILLSSDGQEFHATTRILQSNSPYFMVARNLEKAVNGKLALDIRGKILAEVRRWIYIKTIDVQKFKLEDLFDLLSIAESYGMEDLKDKVGEILDEYPITDENVLEMFERADQAESKKLMKRCVDYLCENIQSVLQNTKVFIKIPSDLVLEINRKVPLQKIPNYHVAIGNWAKGRQTGVARKVLQETLNFKQMPNTLLVDMLETMFLKDDDIFAEQVIHTLTSELANSLTLSGENRIKLDNIENINLEGQNKEISKDTFFQILNTERETWFHVQCWYDETQVLEIYFNEPIYVNQLSWKSDARSTFICCCVFDQDGQTFRLFFRPEKGREELKALKITLVNEDIAPYFTYEVFFKKTVSIRKIAFKFTATFTINSLFAN